MRRHKEHKGDVYSIHEVFFDKEDNVVTYTEDALTPEKESISDLKNLLLDCLKQEKAELIFGDSNCTYSKEDIKYWLEYITEPPIIY